MIWLVNDNTADCRGRAKIGKARLDNIRKSITELLL